MGKNGQGSADLPSQAYVLAKGTCTCPKGSPLQLIWSTTLLHRPPVCEFFKATEAVMPDEAVEVTPSQPQAQLRRCYAT